MPIDVYYALISPPARAVLITAKYLGIEINRKEVDLFAGGARTPEYLKINPSHTVPTLVDEDGFAIFESRAIMAYLVNRYAPKSSLYPGDDTKTRSNVDKVLFYDASTLFPAIRGVLLPRLLHQTEPTLQAENDLKEKVEIIEMILGDQTFFAGDQATLADISIGVSIPILKLFYPSLVSGKLQAWYDRVQRDIPELEELNDQVDYKPFLEKMNK